MHDSEFEATPCQPEPWHIPAAAHGAIALLILAVTCASLHFFYTQGLSNLSGDGLAHMESARRLFDSLTPGYEEIGTVWLPLYHLICAPLVLNDFLWRSGLAGGLVSSMAFALTAYLLFRLGAEMNRNLAAGLVALAGALLSPSLLYLASTPLTEPLALMWLVLVAYALFRYSQSGSWKSLVGAAVAALMGTLTRYEGWNILPFAVLLVFFLYPYPWRQRLLRAVFFAGVAITGPLLWLIHNAHRFNNPLEFYNGRGSAREIYLHQVATTAFAYPTDGSVLLSMRYYLEDLKLVIGVWALELAVLGLVAWCAGLHESRRRAVAGLFIIPLPFYIQAMAHAAIPLYVPTLFPHAYYNLRYGAEMIAAVALFPSFILSQRLGKALRIAVLAAIVAVLAVQFVQLTKHGASEMPLVKEGILNTPCRAPRQKAIIDFLRSHYDGKRLLVAVGKWPCLEPQLGINFRNTITNLNRPYWFKMQTEPAQWAGWIIRSDGDAVDGLMQTYPQAFTDFDVADQGTYPGEGSFTIYQLRKK